MKRLLTTLCLVLLSSCSQEVPTEVTSQSPEVITGPVLIRDGITYHQDTNKPITGIVESFHDNGQLRTRENYIDGELDGLQESFHENGQLSSRSNFIDGVQDGLFELFHVNGQLSIRQNYIDGKADGPWETFDQDGNLTETRTYRNGEVVESNYHLNP